MNSWISFRLAFYMLSFILTVFFLFRLKMKIAFKMIVCEHRKRRERKNIAAKELWQKQFRRRMKYQRINLFFINYKTRKVFVYEFYFMHFRFFQHSYVFSVFERKKKVSLQLKNAENCGNCENKWRFIFIGKSIEAKGNYCFWTFEDRRSKTVSNHKAVTHFWSLTIQRRNLEAFLNWDHHFLVVIKYTSISKNYAVDI